MVKQLLGIAVAATLLTGCATWSVRNPVTINELAEVESAYGIALSIAVAYRNLPLCKRSMPIAINNVCAHRSVLVKLQDADKVVQTGLKDARTFIRDNPNLNASSAIQVVRDAVDILRQIEANNKVY